MNYRSSSSDNAGVVVAALAGVFLLLLFAPVVGALFGGIAGAIVGIFFADTILPVVHQFVPGVTMWQLGVTLGFISGFFKSQQSNSNKNNK